MHNLDRTLDVNEAEYEFEFAGEAEQEAEYEGLGEMEQLELAAELLEVSNEQELENFLGDVFKSIGKGVSNFANSSDRQGSRWHSQNRGEEGAPDSGRRGGRSARRAGRGDGRLVGGGQSRQPNGVRARRPQPR